LRQASRLVSQVDPVHLNALKALLGHLGEEVESLTAVLERAHVKLHELIGFKERCSSLVIENAKLRQE